LGDNTIEMTYKLPFIFFHLFSVLIPFFGPVLYMLHFTEIHEERWEREMYSRSMTINAVLEIAWKT